MPSSSGDLGLVDMIESQNQLIAVLTQVAHDIQTLAAAVQELRTAFLAHDHGASDKYAGGSMRIMKSHAKLVGEEPAPITVSDAAGLLPAPLSLPAA